MSNDIGNWQELEREDIFKKYGRGMERVRFRLPKGNESDFYLRSGHSSIACLALTKDKQVILVKQFRPGPKKVLLEIPGGGIGEGETVERAMERELLEETGYKGKVQFLTSIIPDAYSQPLKNALIVLDCEKVAEPKLEDNGEEVEVVLMSLDEFRAHIRTGQMTDIEIGYLCLDHLGLL
jgi:ADP-ribose pyrophosphatase